MMARTLLDTNILIYLADPQSARHAGAQAASQALLKSGSKLVLAPQVIYEFWTVATRPAAANGMGWPIAETRLAVESLIRQFDLLGEPPEVLDLWLDLVARHNLRGKRIHDAHLLATMKANRVTRLLTVNATDFPPEPGISILVPES